jgi:hypothetical protein
MASVPTEVQDTDTDVIRLSYRPYFGFAAPNFIQITDVGNTDNGTTYRAYVTTKPYIMAGLLNKFGTMASVLLAAMNADPSVRIRIRVIRDFGVETNEVTTDFTPETAELTLEEVIKVFDDFVMSNARAVQFEWGDIP